MQLELEKLRTLEQVREFTESAAAGLERMGRASAYELVTRTRSLKGGPEGGGLLRRSMALVTGLSVSQVVRLQRGEALAEPRNASTLRCHPGHEHILQRSAPELDRFLCKRLVPCLNFHRPCQFASETVDARG